MGVYSFLWEGPPCPSLKFPSSLPTLSSLCVPGVCSPNEIFSFVLFIPENELFWKQKGKKHSSSYLCLDSVDNLIYKAEAER